jgi:hypothetical protein
MDAPEHAIVKNKETIANLLKPAFERLIAARDFDDNPIKSVTLKTKSRIRMAP